MASSVEIKLSVADDEDKEVKLMIQRAQWLRAAILGANDGLLSTTSLMLGVGAAKEDQGLMIISGLAGALAGAFSMAVGEFVSVSTQRDIEQTTIQKTNSEAQISGLRNGADSTDVKPQESVAVKGTYVGPSQQKVSPATHIFSPPPRSPLMKVVARDTRPNPLQDSIFNMEEVLPNPYKAAGASWFAFLCGSLIPLLPAMLFSDNKSRVVGIVVVTSITLLVFGAGGAHFGGLPVRLSAMRVVLGGWISMAVTYGLLKPLHRDHDKGHDTD